MYQGKRKPIPKSLRFEVLARDNFTCQYCGAKATDGALLHIDHIVPVKEGGTNEITNLVAACADCNLGKGAKMLDRNAAAARKQKQLEELQELHEQRQMLYEWEMSLLESENNKIETVCDLIEQLTDFSVNDYGMVDLRKWVKKFGLLEVMDATRVAFTYYECSTSAEWNDAFNKIPGICWNRSHKSCRNCRNCEFKYDYNCRCKLDGNRRTEDDRSYIYHNYNDAEMCDAYDPWWS